MRAGVGLLALACLGTVLRERSLRQRIGVPVGLAVTLIAAQAVLGAALIDQGTSTRWLFLHQGNAALILACVLIAVLRLLDPGTDELQLVGRQRTSDELELVGPRRLACAAAVSVWLMLVLGGLLAASRHDLPSGGILA